MNQRKRNEKRAQKLCDYILNRYNKWYKQCEYCGKLYNVEKADDFEYEDFCSLDCKYKYSNEY